MQLTNTTDYAIRIVCYLAAQNKKVTSTELSQKLTIPVTYIPKITKQLKKEHIIYPMEGINGGYRLMKEPEEISLRDVISCTESNMCISRCLENDKYCSLQQTNTCKVHKALSDLQFIFDNKLETIKISDLIDKENDKSKEFYMILKVDLDSMKYETIYSQDSEVFKTLKENESYHNFISEYVKEFVMFEDQGKTLEFLDKKSIHILKGTTCIDENFYYRRMDKNKQYVWMKVNKHIDLKENTMILTFHNEQLIPKHVHDFVSYPKQDVMSQYWNMVSLLITVLNHNNLVTEEKQRNISYYTQKVYEQLQKNYPEYEIADEEIEYVSRLAPIHDIGKIKVPFEILNKKGKLTKEEMDIVKQHPLAGAEMTLKFPKSSNTEKLNEYSYEICLHHHERYDGNGYPDGLVGEQIPICAQVVGLVDAYDALVSERPYKRKLEHEEAIRMIVSGECGKFSDQLIRCFLAASMQREWIEKSK